MSKARRVAIYLRCSTKEQSTAMQSDELLAYASSRGWTVIQVYEEKISGTHDRRPEWQACMAAARTRSFDILLCWKLDRIFRSLKGMILALAELADLGVEFACLKDPIDMTTPSGKLMTHLLAAFAEFEASLIKTRVVAGLAHARSKGVRLGRPRRIDAEKVIAMRRAGASLSQIAKAVGATKSAVSKTLTKSGLQVPEITSSKKGESSGEKSKV